MRDQNFQQLMNTFNIDLQQQDNIPGSRSEVVSSFSTGEAKPDIIEKLDSQLAFKQFLKRNLSNRKPSSEFIKSIQSRIKIIDTTTNNL